MYKERLKEYIEQDTIYQDWCDNNLSYVSDFDRFCVEHCRDIKNLLNEAEELHNKIDKAIELNREIDKSLRMKNTSAYIELEDIIFEQWKMLKKDSDVDE